MGRNHIGARQVDIFRNTGPSGQVRRSYPQSNVIITGVTPDPGTQETEPKWKIWRIYTLGGIEITEFANNEKYTEKWSEHLTLFPVVPADPPPAVEEGIPFNGWARVSTTPGSFVDVLTFSVPVTARAIRLAGVSCCISGLWELVFGTTIIASGNTSPGEPNSSRLFNPRVSAASAISVKIRFKARPGSPIVPIDGFIDANDF